MYLKLKGGVSPKYVSTGFKLCLMQLFGDSVEKEICRQSLVVLKKIWIFKNWQKINRILNKKEKAFLFYNTKTTLFFFF